MSFTHSWRSASRAYATTLQPKLIRHPNQSSNRSFRLHTSVSESSPSLRGLTYRPHTAIEYTPLTILSFPRRIICLRKRSVARLSTVPRNLQSESSVRRADSTSTPSFHQESDVSEKCPSENVSLNNTDDEGGGTERDGTKSRGRKFVKWIIVGTASAVGCATLADADPGVKTKFQQTSPSLFEYADVNIFPFLRSFGLYKPATPDILDGGVVPSVQALFCSNTAATRNSIDSDNRCTTNDKNTSKIKSVDKLSSLNENINIKNSSNISSTTVNPKKSVPGDSLTSSEKIINHRDTVPYANSPRTDAVSPTPTPSRTSLPISDLCLIPRPPASSASHVSAAPKVESRANTTIIADRNEAEEVRSIIEIYDSLDTTGNSRKSGNGNTVKTNDFNTNSVISLSTSAKHNDTSEKTAIPPEIAGKSPASADINADKDSPTIAPVRDPSGSLSSSSSKPLSAENAQGHDDTDNEGNDSKRDATTDYLLYATIPLEDILSSEYDYIDSLSDGGARKYAKDVFRHLANVRKNHAIKYLNDLNRIREEIELKFKNNRDYEMKQELAKWEEESEKILHEKVLEAKEECHYELLHKYDEVITGMRRDLNANLSENAEALSDIKDRILTLDQIMDEVLQRAERFSSLNKIMATVANIDSAIQAAVPVDVFVKKLTEQVEDDFVLSPVVNSIPTSYMDSWKKGGLPTPLDYHRILTNCINRCIPVAFSERTNGIFGHILGHLFSFFYVLQPVHPSNQDLTQYLPPTPTPILTSFKGMFRGKRQPKLRKTLEVLGKAQYCIQKGDYGGALDYLESLEGYTKLECDEDLRRLRASWELLQIIGVVKARISCINAEMAGDRSV